MATVKVPIEVRFRDLDALGHVNNAVVMTYFEEGRKHLFLHVLNGEKVEDFNFILAHVRCDYLLPIRLADHPQLNLWVDSVGTKSFTIGYRLQERDDAAKVFAKGLSVQVWYDYGQNRPMQVPAEMRTILAQYSGATE
jgi:acyl-CoA thioester hydrolase